MFFQSNSGTYVQGAYRTHRIFRSERAKNISDDVSDGDDTDDGTDAELSDCDVSGSDSNLRSEESCDASAHEAVFVPSNKRDKRKSVDINAFNQSHAHVNARLRTTKTASQIGVQLIGRLYECSGCSRAKWVRYPVRKKASVRATRGLQRIMADLVGPKELKTIERDSHMLSCFETILADSLGFIF